MDASLVKQQILDVPPPFVRSDATFTALINAQAFAESLYTIGSDASSGNLSVTSSSNGYLSAWGEIFGITRAANESNAQFLNRLTGTLVNPVGTAASIIQFGQLILGQTIEVNTNPNGIGYTINIPSATSSDLIDRFIASLNRIRPAGVPFTINLETEPLILETYAYAGSPSFAGAYLGYGTEPYTYTLSSSTPSATLLAPDNIVTDPLLNNNVALGFVS